MNNNILLINEDYIKNNTNIDDNLSGGYLLPAIKIAQNMEVEQVLGTSLLYSIQSKILDNSIENVENEKYKELLDVYLQDFLAYASIKHIIMNVSTKIANAGAMKTDDEKMYGADNNEKNELINYYSNIADYYKYRTQLYLVQNFKQFPELTDIQIKNISSNLYSAAGCNVWLGGSRGKYLTPMSYEEYLRMKYDTPNTPNKK